MTTSFTSPAPNRRVVDPGKATGVLARPGEIHPTIAFVLLVLVAAFGLSNPFVLLQPNPWAFLSPASAEWAAPGQTFAGEAAACSLFSFAFSILALLAGVTTLRRERYYFSLAGTLLGMATISFCLINLGLGLLALVLIASSREHFRS